MVFFVAEAGINHAGSIEHAVNMIRVAKEAGADAIKFQSFTAANLGYDAELTVKLAGWQLSPLDHTVLFAECAEHGIEFMSTPFDTDWCDFLVELGVKRLKISSGKVRDLDFVHHVASKRLPVIMSCGMATVDQVLDACENFYDEEFQDVTGVSLLYCISKYPAPLSEVDFREMQRLAAFGDGIGFSDHTLTGDASIIAAASGAQVIERHFTLDRSLPGPDQCCSSTPDELKRIIGEIRNVG